MEYAFKQVIAKENKKEKESILRQIKKYKDRKKEKILGKLVDKQYIGQYYI